MAATPLETTPTPGGVELADTGLLKRDYALRFRPGVSLELVHETIQQFNGRLADRLPGEGFIFPRCTIEPGNSADDASVEAYHLYADETLWQAFLARGFAIGVDDVVELTSGGNVQPTTLVS